jgi:predicted ATPase/DNA-binding SARP family transcriptional activator
MLPSPWRFELFGGLRARQDTREITRFRTRKTASLLAYLAYFPTRTPSRDELAELFWPDAAPNAGRVNLRAALASLRRQLEPPNVPTGTVLLADNATIRLRPAAFTSDVADFERLLRSEAASADTLPALVAAVALYRGELLPGYYDEWIFPERMRAAESCYGALCRLAEDLERSGDLERALDYALRGVGLDALREEAHSAVIRLYAATGRPTAALSQYRVLERLLQKEWNMRPSQALRAMIAGLREPSERASIPFSTFSKAPSKAVPPSAEKPSALAPQTSSLPLPLTRFFGREDEIAALLSLLSRTEDPWPDAPRGGARLITLTGPGGSGKTRLALEVARRWEDTFEHAVYFAALAELSDITLLPDKLLTTLGLTRIGEADPLARVIAALRRHPALLVLDNFEQLVASGVEVIGALCSVPGLTCLITSRQRLGIEGEREFPVPPLPTPVPPRTAADLAAFPSVQLFTDRAQLVRPDFQITARNAAAVGKLCYQLEGLPLALELAASWATVLTPAQMLAQMEDRFAFLVGRNTGRPLRHQTLHNAIESSYRLLNPELQRLFARLAIFRGGWTWEAAQQICAAPDTLRNLALLQEHSLVLTSESGNTMRFSMLETLREFAWTQLTPVEQAEIAALYARYFLRLAEEAAAALDTADQAIWLERLEAEHANLRAALAWYGSEAGDVEMLYSLACALARFWFLHGYFQEGRKRLEEALACDAPTLPPQLRARALLESGTLAHFQGDNGVAMDCVRQSLDLYEAAGDERGVARSYRCLGNIATVQGDYAAAAVYQEAVLEFWRRRGGARDIAAALNNIGNTANAGGDYAAARAAFEEGLVLARTVQDASLTAVLVGNLGLTALFQGDLTAAQVCFEESFVLRRQIGNRQGIAGSKANLAMVAFEQGELEEAIRLNAEALDIQKDLGDRNGIAYSLEAWMRFASATGDARKAAQCGGAAEALRAEIASPLTMAYFCAHRERSLELLRTRLDAATLHEAWKQGRAMTLEQAVALTAKEA